MSAFAKADPPARTNPRAERTRAALVAAGRRLFAARPVEAVTIDDIVQAAAVGKGSFYNHFEGREALLRAIAREIRAGVEHQVDLANAGVADPAHRMARAICTYLRYALDDAERAGVLVRLYSGHFSLTAPLNRGLMDDIAAGLAASRFAVQTVETGMLFVIGVTQVTLVRLVQEPGLSLAVSLAQQMSALVLRGLGVEAAEAERIAAQASDEIVRQGAFAGADDDRGVQTTSLPRSQVAVIPDKPRSGADPGSTLRDDEQVGPG